MDERPAGITIIAILVAVQGVVAILSGLEAAGLTTLGLGAAADSESAGYADLVIGVITLVASYGLLTTRDWAWLVTVVVTVIRIVTGALAIALSGAGSLIGIGGGIAVVIGLVVLRYCLRSDVKAAFGR